MCSIDHTPGSPASPERGESGPSYSQLPGKPRLQRVKRSITHPGEVEDDIEERLKELGLTFQEWIEDLMAFDLMVSGKHQHTKDFLKRLGSSKGRWAMWREAIEMRRNRIPHASVYDVLFARREALKGK